MSDVKTISADAVVVGSGAGGATTAKLLAEAGRDVVILEEGARHTAESFNGSIPDLMAHLYRDGGVSPIFGRPPIPFAEGRCVGGTTVINGGVFWRAPAKVLARWAQEFALPEMTEAALAPHFDALERDFAVKFHAEPDANRASDLLVAGAEALGWRWSDVPRGQIGCRNSNRCPTGCPNNAKQSVLLNYIPAALARGARLITEARVERIVTRDGRAQAVQASISGADGGRRALTVRSDAIFVCAGPMQTPYLLARSGVGHAAGQGLQLHLNLKAVAVFRDDIDPGAGTILTKQVKEFEDRDIYLATTTFDPVYLALAMAPHGPAEVDAVMADWRRAGIFMAQLKADATGRVRALPLVDRPVASYRLTRRDIANFRFAIEQLGEVLLAAGAEKVFLPVAGSGAVTDRAGVRRIAEGRIDVKALDLVCVHAHASCGLGRALDAFGQVQGVRGLHVNDASMLPDAPGVSPQMTIMALARRNVLDFLERRGRA
jgi:choline dehydrogenase-like flavoprotein